MRTAVRSFPRSWGVQRTQDMDAASAQPTTNQMITSVVVHDLARR